MSSLSFSWSGAELQYSCCPDSAPAFIHKLLFMTSKDPFVLSLTLLSLTTLTLAHREEARLVQALADAITTHPAWPERSASMAQSLPRSPSNRPRAHTIVSGGKVPRFRHPVWNSGSATNVQRVALLKLLLSAEAERLQVSQDA